MEFLGEAVEAHGLPVALGVRHPEVARDVLLGRCALLLADDDDRPSVEVRDPADDRGIVTEAAVAVQLVEAIEDAPDDVERVRTLDVARGLHRLPGAHARHELRGLGDEVRVHREVTVAFHGALRSGDAIEHRHR